MRQLIVQFRRQRRKPLTGAGLDDGADQQRIDQACRFVVRTCLRSSPA